MSLLTAASTGPEEHRTGSLYPRVNSHQLKTNRGDWPAEAQHQGRGEGKARIGKVSGSAPLLLFALLVSRAIGGVLLYSG